MDKNKIIYRYSDYNNLCEASLLNRYFWFSKPIYFNDPFDCNMETLLAFGQSKAIFEKIESNFGNENLYEDIKEKTDNFGVLCFTRKTEDGEIGDKGFNNSHFWSHYANNHKGVCLGFDSEKIENYYSKKIYCNAKLLDVIYRDSPIDLGNYDFVLDDSNPNLIRTQKITGIFGGTIDFKDVDSFCQQLLLHKDKRIWGIENECRIILGGFAIQKLEKLKPFGNKPFGRRKLKVINKYGYMLPYPKQEEVLKEVTFGVNFDENRIKRIIKRIDTFNKNVKYYKAKLDFENADILRDEI